MLAPRTVRRAPLARERNFCSDLKSQLLCLFISPAAVAGCQARRPCLLKTHFSCPARSSSLLAALRCSVEIKRCKVCSGVPGGWWCVCGDGGGGGAVPASRVPPAAGAVSRVPSRLSPLRPPGRHRAPGSRRGGVTALAPPPSHFLPSGAAAPRRRPSGSWVWLGERGRGPAGSGAGRRGGGGGLEISTRGGGGQRLIPLAAPSRSRAEPEQRGHRCPGRRAGDAVCPLSRPPRAPSSSSAPGVRPGAPSRLSVASAEEGGGGDVAAHPRGREPDGFVPLGEGGRFAPRRFVRPRRRRCPPGRAPVRPPRPGPGSQLPHPWHCPSAPSLLRHPRAAGSFPFSSRTI